MTSPVQQGILLCDREAIINVHVSCGLARAMNLPLKKYLLCIPQWLPALDQVYSYCIQNSIIMYEARNLLYLPFPH